MSCNIVTKLRHSNKKRFYIWLFCIMLLLEAFDYIPNLSPLLARPVDLVSKLVSTGRSILQKIITMLWLLLPLFLPIIFFNRTTTFLYILGDSFAFCKRFCFLHSIIFDKINFKISIFFYVQSYN
jgi:hypothetical protein